MDTAKVPTIILRVVDIVMSCLMLGIFYGTNSHFSLTSTSSDNFGEATLIMFFILSLGALGMEVAQIPGQHKMILCAYNIVAAVFYFTAGIIILATWSEPPVIYILRHESGGLWTGSFCIIQTVGLIVGAILYIKGAKSGE